MKFEITEEFAKELEAGFAEASFGVPMENVLAAAKMASVSHFMDDLNPALRARMVAFAGLIIAGVLIIDEMAAKENN